MCLETTKQGYVILSAFNQAGAAGLTWNDMMEKMEEISCKVFTSNRYVNGPWPLMASLDNLIDSDGISTNEDGLWAITERGKKDFRIIRDRYVKPEFSAA